MTAIHSLKDLCLHELSDLYSAETQIIEGLPKLIAAVSNKKLSQALSQHLTATQGHLMRLDKVFDKLGEKPSGEVCAGMKGLITESTKLLAKGNSIDAPLLDAAIISAIQRIEHYEMAGYGCARTYCQQLGESDCEALLRATLFEEDEADKLLTRLALDEINLKAQKAIGASA
jgi:ferritin-like metal-binding protein YciE